MGKELVQKTNLKREKGYLYFIGKDGYVYRTKIDKKTDSKQIDQICSPFKQKTPRVGVARVCELDGKNIFNCFTIDVE
jgi:hypothetical protein